jgi:hypothetical protein
MLTFAYSEEKLLIVLRWRIKSQRDFLKDVDYSHTAAIILLIFISIIIINNMPKWLGKLIFAFIYMTFWLSLMSLMCRSFLFFFLVSHIAFIYINIYTQNILYQLSLCIFLRRLFFCYNTVNEIISCYCWLKFFGCHYWDIYIRTRME